MSSYNEEISKIDSNIVQGETMLQTLKALPISEETEQQIEHFDKLIDKLRDLRTSYALLQRREQAEDNEPETRLALDGSIAGARMDSLAVDLRTLEERQGRFMDLLRATASDQQISMAELAENQRRRERLLKELQQAEEKEEVDDESGDHLLVIRPGSGGGGQEGSENGDQARASADQGPPGGTSGGHLDLNTTTNTSGGEEESQGEEDERRQFVSSTLQESIGKASAHIQTIDRYVEIGTQMMRTVRGAPRSPESDEALALNKEVLTRFRELRSNFLSLRETLMQLHEEIESNDNTNLLQQCSSFTSFLHILENNFDAAKRCFLSTTKLLQAAIDRHCEMAQAEDAEEEELENGSMGHRHDHSPNSGVAWLRMGASPARAGNNLPADRRHPNVQHEMGNGTAPSSNDRRARGASARLLRPDLFPMAPSGDTASDEDEDDEKDVDEEESVTNGMSAGMGSAGATANSVGAEDEGEAEEVELKALRQQTVHEQEEVLRLLAQRELLARQLTELRASKEEAIRRAEAADASIRREMSANNSWRPSQHSPAPPAGLAQRRDRCQGDDEEEEEEEGDARLSDLTRLLHLIDELSPSSRARVMDRAEGSPRPGGGANVVHGSAPNSLVHYDYSDDEEDEDNVHEDRAKRHQLIRRENNTQGAAGPARPLALSPSKPLNPDLALMPEFQHRIRQLDEKYRELNRLRDMLAILKEKEAAARASVGMVREVQDVDDFLTAATVAAGAGQRNGAGAPPPPSAGVGKAGRDSVTFQEPVATLMANDELYENLRETRVRREELRDRQAAAAAGRRVPVAMETASQDRTTAATWGGSSSGGGDVDLEEGEGGANGGATSTGHGHGSSGNAARERAEAGRGPNQPNGSEMDQRLSQLQSQLSGITSMCHNMMVEQARLSQELSETRGSIVHQQHQQQAGQPSRASANAMDDTASNASLPVIPGSPSLSVSGEHGGSSCLAGAGALRLMDSYPGALLTPAFSSLPFPTSPVPGPSYWPVQNLPMDPAWLSSRLAHLQSAMWTHQMEQQRLLQAFNYLATVASLTTRGQGASAQSSSPHQQQHVGSPAVAPFSLAGPSSFNPGLPPWGGWPANPGVANGPTGLNMGPCFGSPGQLDFNSSWPPSYFPSPPNPYQQGGGGSSSQPR